MSERQIVVKVPLDRIHEFREGIRVHGTAHSDDTPSALAEARTESRAAVHGWAKLVGGRVIDQPAAAIIRATARPRESRPTRVLQRRRSGGRSRAAPVPLADTDDPHLARLLRALVRLLGGRA